ncbi:helix-turn-helix domain-containing protein [Yeosuana marina]|uniref:winged helix-turn-helix transcriptional regulator n=1 Tax=Yeosuana marina TaxID=1565536 RepID=UPI0030EEAFA2|tara:strand:+ start:1569 stop:1925 length:357 start_codon:yes stop_codon:yes gene_type:complete
MKKNDEFYGCPVTATLDVIGGKWKPIVLYVLMSGTKRFGELAVRIPRISRKVLTDQLKELERDGLVRRAQFKEIPPRVEYSITERGESLSVVFNEMAIWGRKNILINNTSLMLEKEQH